MTTINNSLKKSWRLLEGSISKRLIDFKHKWKNGSDEDIFAELVFCLFTPQSKAKSCWASVNVLLDKDLLLKGVKSEIAKELNRVRFRNNKAGYLILASLAFIRRRLLLLIAALAGLGFALHLSYIEKDILQVWCLYCVISQAIIALITLLSLGWLVAFERSRLRGEKPA